MTEHDWLTATDPTPMLEFLRDQGSERKLRLAICAACRRFWAAIPQDAHRRAVEIGELFADGLLTDEGRQDGLDLANTRVGGGALACRRCVHPDAFLAAKEGLKATIGMSAPFMQTYEERERTRREDQVWQANLLRDIFGNPFRPVAIDPAWRTSTVVALARGIYDEKAFDRMPILADALQDAGCDSDDVLSHCRGGGSHVRGCWVVDLILGKK